MTSPRERILGRVRAAIAGRERVAHPGPLVTADSVAGGGNADGFLPGAGFPDRPMPGVGDDSSVAAANARRFAERFQANGGEVVQFPSAVEAREWLDGFVADGEGVATGVGMPAGLVPAAPARPAESARIGVSFASGAAAETGTLLLDSGEGRRQQLLPPVHVVWVRMRDIDGTLGEALARLKADRGGVLPAAVGLHSAPSKSADIGRILVVGVHGPGRVIAAIIEKEEVT